MVNQMYRLLILCLASVYLSGCASPSPAPVEERAAATVVNPYVLPKQQARAIPLEENGSSSSYSSENNDRSNDSYSGGFTDDRSSGDTGGNDAVISLLELSEKQESVGRQDAAAATLERALRIQPQNPVLWQRLAQIRLNQGQLDQADGLAAKAMALAANNPKLRSRIWQLVADIRRGQGDIEGERAALVKSSELSGD